MQEKRQKGNRNKKKKNLEAGILATLLLLLFRIPLARIIGDEANGYLAVSWEIYSLFYLIFGFTYSGVVSKMVKTRIEKGLYRNSIRSMSTVLLTGIFSAIIGALALYMAASGLAGLFPGEKMVEISLHLFALLLLCRTVLGIFRGYFEGMGSRVPTDVSRLVEAVVTATGALLFVFAATGYGEKVGALLHNEHFGAGFAAAGVVIGYLCGNVFSLLFLGFVYILYKKGYNRLLKRDNTRVFEQRSGIVREAMVLLPSVLLPVFFLKLYRLVNLWIYGQQLSGEEDRLKGIGIIGSFYGKTTVLMALAVVLILFFCEGGKRRNKKQLIQNEFRTGKQMMTEELQKLFLLALPVAGSFIALSDVFLKTVYQTASRNDCRLLAIAGGSVVFISLGVYLYRLLSFLQVKKQVIIVQAGAFILQLVFMIFFVRLPAIGTLTFSGLSLGAAELVFWILFSLGQLIILLKIYRLRLPWGNMVLFPLIRTVIMVAVQILIVQLLKEVIPSWTIFLLGIGMGIVVYELVGRISLFHKV